VYQKSGPSSYQLNHFGLGYDSSGNFIGPAQIQESIEVDKKAQNHSGTFTIDQFENLTFTEEKGSKTKSTLKGSGRADPVWTPRKAAEPSVVGN